MAWRKLGFQDLGDLEGIEVAFAASARNAGDHCGCSSRTQFTGYCGGVRGSLGRRKTTVPGPDPEESPPKGKQPALLLVYGDRGPGTGRKECALLEYSSGVQNPRPPNAVGLRGARGETTRRRGRAQAMLKVGRACCAQAGSSQAVSICRAADTIEQPLAVHRHWHIDVSYVSISGTLSKCAAFWTVQPLNRQLGFAAVDDRSHHQWCHSNDKPTPSR
jgi:hypothetical protein